MKTRALCLIAAGLLSSGCLFAQSAVDLKVTVPFGFQAGEASYPAGEYTVARMNHQPLALVLKSVDRKHGGIVLAGKVYKTARETTPSLIFNRYAGTYFLCEVWGPGGHGNRLRPTKVEKDFAGRMGRTAEQIMVATAIK